MCKHIIGSIATFAPALILVAGSVAQAPWAALRYAATAPASGPVTSLPEPLQRAVTSRLSIDTYEIEYAVARYDDGAASGAPYWFRTRGGADDSLAQTALGYDGRYPLLSVEGFPVGACPISELVRDGLRFRYTDGYPDFEVFRAESGWVTDLRMLGMTGSSAPGSSRSLVAFREQLPGKGTGDFWVRQSPAYEVVTYRADSGLEIEWSLAPDKGCNPERVAISRNGQLVQELECQLMPVGNLWFPYRVSFYDARGALQQEVEIDFLEINAPSQPRTLTPEDIGIDVGMATRPNELAPLRGVWDGGQIESFDQWHEEYRRGNRAPGERAREIWSRWRAEDVPTPNSALMTAYRNYLVGATGPTPVRFKPTRLLADAPGARTRILVMWEAYVRAFTARHRLDTDQVQKAWSILKDCLDRADNCLLRAGDELREIGTMRQALRGAAKEADVRHEFSRLVERERELLKPVDSIFQDSLKPRLDSILTRAQRSATSQPR
jgi:hypothetical protein